MPAGAWGHKPSDAIRAPPPPSASSQSSKNHQQRGGGNRNGRGGGRGRYNNNNGGRGRGRGRGRGGGGRHNGNNNHQKGGGINSGNSSNTNLANVKLCMPGDGTTTAQKAVRRLPASFLLDLRIAFANVETPSFLPDVVQWLEKDDSEKIGTIEASVKNRKGGDVSAPNRKPKIMETAPPLEDCKPLEINEETRWKAKVFNPDDKESANEGEESDDEILKKALLILNKLSLTKFDKLSDEFVATGIGRSTGTLNGCVGLIVEKAQSEPHFSTMYAMLCIKLTKTSWSEEVGGKKAFKKCLLTRCQEEFQNETSDKIARAIEGIDDKAEQEYKANLIKKAYLGHMRFLGELYKGDLLKIDVMEDCLKTLLEGEEHSKGLDEERVECFAQLMTTIGSSLEQHAEKLKIEKKKTGPSEALDNIWKIVDDVARGGQVSNRLKYMLLDLEDLRDNGWVKRRKEETAKTIEQIHKEVAKEEARAAKRSNSIRSVGRRDSERSLRRSSSKPIIDEDGFRTVMPRAPSSSSLSRAVSESHLPPPSPRVAKPLGGAKRSNSFTTPVTPSPPKLQPEKKASKSAVSYPDAASCAKKATNMLKEFFVSGELDDAILTVEETVGVGAHGSLDRGAKFVEGAVLMVMEMREKDVEKFLKVFNRAITEGKIEKAAVANGLNDPLEFLSEIAIDAPEARSILAMILASFISVSKAFELDMLLKAPEYFKSDGKPAILAAEVIKKLGVEPTSKHEALVEKLMSKDEKDNFQSAKEVIASA